MSLFGNCEDRIVIEEYHDEESEILHIGRANSDGEGGGELTGSGSVMEAEKRIRREIANSNERRRMQSINAGFQSLRTLLPHHEGEKLSKAAILQQTAEYIYALEQEKTRLLSQNSQLKRLVNQHECGEAPTKKRKGDTVMIPVSESSDEGLGSMSPEPVALLTVTPNAQTPAVNLELMDLRAQLERERRLRIILEDQVRGMEVPEYPDRMLQYQHQEVIEHTDNLREVQVERGMIGVTLIQETAAAVAQLQDIQCIPEIEDVHGMEVVSMDSLPPVAHTQIVETCSQPPSRSQSPIAVEVLVKSERDLDPLHHDIEIVSSVSHPRLPSVLEAAIKAEPKVEVERMSSPGLAEDSTPASRFSLATSRQNLETIVEAIRHLEGDHMFGEEPASAQRAIVRVEHTEPAQEVPLALTHKPARPARQLQVEMNPFLHFHAPSTVSLVQQQQQCRPGVIVVKQNS